MAEIVKGLFGIDPQNYQEDRLAQQRSEAMQYSKLDPFQKATTAIYQGTQQGIGAGLNMMGVQDPELQAQQVAAQLAGQFDKTTPEGMAEFARALGEKAQELRLPALSNFSNMAGQKALSMKNTSLDNQNTQLDINRKTIAAEQEAKMRDEIANLGPNPTDEQILNVYRKYGTPDKQAIAIERNLINKDKLQAKADAAQQKQDELNATLIDNAVTGKNLVETIRKDVGYNTVGTGALLSWVPMSDAREFDSNVKTLRSKLTDAAMAAAKAQSKTGATGYGALNSKELEVLQTEIATLDTKLSPAQFNKKLDTINEYFNKMQNKATGNKPAGGNNPPPNTTGVSALAAKIRAANANNPDVAKMSDAELVAAARAQPKQ